MANILQAPRGTADILPEESARWRYVEQTQRDVARKFGFGEIRFPTFEYTELFSRGVGDTTDVVQKEMYTFEDRGGRSVTLRPEGTASTVRALLQNGLHNGPMPLRLFYQISCFRGERPQAGRLREFHQFGAELFGASSPCADVELVLLARGIFDALGVKGLRLEINSIGCPECRKNYHAALQKYFESRKDGLCDTCKGRLERNPMRILDCKDPSCQKIARGAPVVLDYICGDCRAHFEQFKAGLESAGVAYTVNPRIVRGLDYYTRTVFEFIDDGQGLTVCGGGRYDGLVKQLGGPSLPALGFAMGLERLMLVMQSQGCRFPAESGIRVYLAPLGGKAAAAAPCLVAQLRETGIAAEYDLLGRSAKAQMKYAGKAGFDFTVVIGDNELEAGGAVLRDMKNGSQRDIPLGADFAAAVRDAVKEIEAEICKENTEEK